MKFDTDRFLILSAIAAFQGHDDGPAIKEISVWIHKQWPNGDVDRLPTTKSISNCLIECHEKGLVERRANGENQGHRGRFLLTPSGRCELNAKMTYMQALSVCIGRVVQAVQEATPTI